MKNSNRLALAVLAALALGSGRAKADDNLPTINPPMAKNPLKDVSGDSVTVTAMPNQSMTVNAYIGMVNGEPLFVDGILRPIDADLQRLAKLAQNVTDFKAAAHDAIVSQLNTQISGMLLMRAAKDSLTEEDTRRVDAFMIVTTKDLLTKYQGSVAMAEMDLRAQGSSMEKELAAKRRDFVERWFLQKTLWPKIVITRRQLLADYQRNIDTFTVPAEVDLYTITLVIDRYLPKEERDGKQVPIADPTPAQIKEATQMTVARANELIEKLKAGGDFAQLARDNSDDTKSKLGGRRPHTHKGDLASKEIEDTAFGLTPNAIAAPVTVIDSVNPSATKVVIIKAGEITPARVISFEEAQNKIELKLREAQFTELTNQYYATLRQHAAIEGSVERMADTVTDAAVTRYLLK